ncbi:hypothetical protein [Lacticaseibacillus absianus]|uniref:hypothetical protein n=1 Tax=Lacticaseibacillus absianus TaxID=2729623 RepID=UPI0015CD11CC|nr:hypothetical protein [Lacticaseibacillus absianus]
MIRSRLAGALLVALAGITSYQALRPMSVPTVTAAKTKHATKPRITSYLEIQNEQTGKSVRYNQTYTETAGSATATTTEGSGWLGLTYAELPCFPRYGLTAPQIKAKVEQIGVTATNKQTWRVTRYTVTYK